MATRTTPRRRTAVPTRSAGIHRGKAVPPAPPMTAQQRHELEDVDQLLAQLIRQNRQLRTQIDKLTHAFTTLGEDQVDGVLETLRRRICAGAKAAPRHGVRPA